MGYSATGKLADIAPVEPLHAAMRRTAQRVGEELHRRTVEHTPVAKPPPGHEAQWLAARKRLPGTLKESWKVGEVEILEGGRLVRIGVYTNDPVGPLVEWPTRPHLIMPRKPGGVLRFWTDLGRTVFALIVHHPGTQGSYMLTTSLAEVAAMWQEIGAEEMQRWARETQAAI